MRLFSAALVLVGCLVVWAPPGALAADGGASLELTLVMGEHSKDSNSRTVRLTLAGDRVTFYGPHEPCARGRCRHSEVTFTLTRAQQEELATVFERHPLPGTFAETKPTDASGHYASVQLLRAGPAGPARVVIAGMTSVFGAPGAADHPKVLSPEARDVVEAVRLIARFFEKLAEPHLATVPPLPRAKPPPDKGAAAGGGRVA